MEYSSYTVNSKLHPPLTGREKAVFCCYDFLLVPLLFSNVIEIAIALMEVILLHTYLRTSSWSESGKNIQILQFERLFALLFRIEDTILWARSY